MSHVTPVTSPSVGGGHHHVVSTPSFGATPSPNRKIGRSSSPALHQQDQGYHTLVSSSRPSTGSPWSDVILGSVPPPALPPHRHVNNGIATPMAPRLSSPGSPSPVLVDTTDHLLACYKGKRLHKASPFDRLTDELVLKMFSYLSANELCVCARVCRRFYFLVWDPRLWTSITVTGEETPADRAVRSLTRLLSRGSAPEVCLSVEKACLNGCARLTDRGLSVLAKRCPKLRRVEVKGCVGVSNNGILELVTRCPHLEHLDVTGCYQVTCVQPGPGEPRPRQLFLTTLDLTDCTALQDVGLRTAVRCCPQLVFLYLRRCVHITDAGIKAIPSYCTALKELSVSDCVQITDFGMYELAKLGPNLRYLSVAKCDQVSDAGVKQIARHCYKLRYLNARGCEAVSDDAIEILARSCPRLRALDIGKCDVTDRGLRLLAEHCPNLKKLSVKSCDMITDKGLQIVAYYCRGLQQLNIQDCQVTIESYRTVRKYCKRCVIEHTNPGFC